MPSNSFINPLNQLSLGLEPPVANRFLLEVDGIQIGIFSAVDGLEATVKTEEVREGGQNGYVHKLPGRIEWPDITLTKGLTQTDELFKWFEKTSGEKFAAKGNKITPTTGAITALTHTLWRLRSWQLEGVYPVKWTGPKFSGESTPLQESLVIAHTGITVQTFPPPPPV